MSVEIVSDQSPKGMSTRKKWLIGCGGCLGVLLVIAVVVMAAISMGWSTLQKGSDDSVKKLFGPTYNSAGYMAFGMPLTKPVGGSMVMMLATDQSAMIFALDTEGMEEYLSILKQTDEQALQDFFKTLGKDFLENSPGQEGSTGKFQGLEFQKTHFVSLSADKRYPVVYAVMETEKSGQIIYIPATAALLPVSEKRAVLLMAMDPKQSSTVADTRFEAVQKGLEEKLNKLVKDSELDDRLLSTTAEQAAK